MMNTPVPCTIPHPHIPHPIRHADTHNTALLQTYLSTTTRMSHIHQSIVPPPYLHRTMQELKHEHTICLRAPTASCDTPSLYLNDQIINHTLQILHKHSPFHSSRHFLPTYFSELIQRPHTNLHRLHRRQLEHAAGASLTHEYLLIPLNIIPIHWTLLVRHINGDSAPSVIYHDSLPILLDTTAIEQHLRQYDASVSLDPGLVPHPIRHAPALIQDDAYNCGVCVLTMTIVYLYSPDPTNFPWQSLNYPSTASHMRNVIISILQSDTPPELLTSIVSPPNVPAAFRTPELTHSLPPNTPRLNGGQPPVTQPHVQGDTHHSRQPIFPMTHIQPVPTTHTKIATWNINWQSSYDVPTKVCLHADIDLLHITEPPAFMSIPDTPSSSGDHSHIR